MLSVNPIARVVVTTSSGTPAPSAFDVGLLLVKDSNYTAARRLQTYLSAEAAVEDLEEMGFASNSNIIAAVTNYFSADPKPGRLLVSCYPSTETPSQALAAVLDLTSSFYGVCVADAAADSVLVTLAATVAASTVPMMLFLPTIGTPSAVVQTDSLLDLLKEAGYDRAITLYCEEVPDAAALMGLAMGLQLANPESAFALAYKKLVGLTPSDLTETQVTAIKNKNGNVYITRGYTHQLLEVGAVASGKRYDEVLYIDQISSELQSAAVDLLANNSGKMPQTDDASAMFINTFSSILVRYFDRGVLATAAWRGQDLNQVKKGDVLNKGFKLWADSYDTQSDLDRAAHKAMPIHVAMILAGSIESVVISVDVQI